MYIPPQFAASDETIQELLSNVAGADLITATTRGMMATFLPLLYEEPGSRPSLTTHGALVGHVARNNDQWRETAIGEALVIIRGPDAYISPSWYESKGEHGRVVPTWNYITAHVYGHLVIHDDPVWVGSLVRGLTNHHERNLARPWSVDDAPVDFIANQLRAIVGIEIAITRVEVKLKLSQNRSETDFAGVVNGLEDACNIAMAGAMRDVMRRENTVI